MNVACGILIIFAMLKLTVVQYRWPCAGVFCTRTIRE